MSSLLYSPGMKIIMEPLLSINQNPKTLREFAVKHGSWLTGFEKRIERIVGLDVEIFTVTQKNYLRVASNEQCYMWGDTLLVGPVTYWELIRRTEVI